MWQDEYDVSKFWTGEYVVHKKLDRKYEMHSVWYFRSRSSIIRFIGLETV